MAGNFYATFPSSVSGSNPSIGANGTPIPLDSTLIGGVGLDGNLHPLSTDNNGVLNVNTVPSGVQHVIVDSSALPTGASTSANQATGNSTLSTIVSNQTNGTQVTSVSNFPATQPISGTVTANQGSANATPWNQNVAQVGGSALALGQQLAAASLPVVLTANQITTLTPLTSVTVTQGTGTNLHMVVDSGSVSVSNFPATQPISGSVTVTQATGTNLHTVVDSGTITAVTAITNALPSGTNLLGKVGIDQTTPGTTNAMSLAQIGATTVSTGNGTSGAGVQRVVIASDQTAFAVTASAGTSATSTITSVAGANSSTSLLASNTSRKGAYFFNDSTAVLYLAFAGSASTSAYTVQIASNGFYEMPNPTVYTGAIFGIWSAANGNVRITELS